MRKITEALSGRRIDHLFSLARAAVEPFAVDMKLQIGVHRVFLANEHFR
jgi:hypothetical protein